MTDPRAFTCADVFRRLDDFLDRELTPDEMDLVERHLETCAQCASEHRFEERILASIRAKLSHLQAPPGLVARVAAVLDEERRRPA